MVSSLALPIMIIELKSQIAIKLESLGQLAQSPNIDVKAAYVVTSDEYCVVLEDGSLIFCQIAPHNSRTNLRQC